MGQEDAPWSNEERDEKGAVELHQHMTSTTTKQTFSQVIRLDGYLESVEKPKVEHRTEGGLRVDDTANEAITYLQQHQRHSNDKGSVTYHAPTSSVTKIRRDEVPRRKPIREITTHTTLKKKHATKSQPREWCEKESPRPRTCIRKICPPSHTRVFQKRPTSGLRRGEDVHTRMNTQRSVFYFIFGSSKKKITRALDEKQ